MLEFHEKILGTELDISRPSPKSLMYLNFYMKPFILSGHLFTVTYFSSNNNTYIFSLSFFYYILII